MAFVSIDMEEVEREADSMAERKTGRTEFDKELFFNFSPGTHRIRILPPGYSKDGTTQTVVIPKRKIAFPVSEHKAIPGTDGKGKFRCITRTYPDSGVECPICSAMKEVYGYFSEKDIKREDQRKYLGKYYVYNRAYCNGIVRDDPTNPDYKDGKLTQEVELDGKKIIIPKVRIIGLPMPVYNWIISQTRLKDTDDGSYMYGDITNPIEGYDVNVTVKGKGIDVEYDVGFNPKRKRLHPDDDAINAILYSMSDIGSIFAMPDKVRYDKAVAMAAAIMPTITGQPSSIDKTGSAEPTEARLPGTSVEGEKPAESQQNTGKDNYPSCYGNHVKRFRKCLICRYELNCEKSPESNSKSDDERKAYHNA